MDENGWCSPPHMLSANDPTVNTFWRSCTDLSASSHGTSWIDHVLLQESALGTITPLQFSLSSGCYWFGVSDHRPITVALASPLFDGGPGPLAPPLMASTLRRRDLVLSDKEAVTRFQDNLRQAYSPLPDPHATSSYDAGTLLQDLSQKSLAALHPKPGSQILKLKYRDGWSPCLVALDSHSRAISRIVYHLKGVGKGKWWSSDAEQHAGVHHHVTHWEKKVYGLKWTDGKIPTDAWVGSTPSDWRLAASDPPLALLQRGEKDLRLIHRALQGRKRREKRMMISYRIRMREYERLRGKLKRAIRSILGTYQPRISLEEMVLGNPEAIDLPPPSVAEIQAILTSITKQPFLTPDHFRDRTGLHDGTLRWEDVQDYKAFREHYRDWGIPMADNSPDEEVLFKIHQAIINVPNRPKVQEELRMLSSNPPSFQAFSEAIRSKSCGTAGGPSGLTYSMMKAD